MPKTGTQSVRQALAAHLAEDDWQQHALFGHARLPIPELAARQHGHLGVCDVLPLLPAEIWKTYFKFGFVRNPFDRFVSAYVFLFRRSLKQQPRSPDELIGDMKAALQRARFRRRVLIQPQNELLEDKQGRLALDFIGRYEQLESDFEFICQHLGICASLPHSNPSEHLHYSHYYDDELRTRVSDFYARDFEQFDYAFHSDVKYGRGHASPANAKRRDTGAPRLSGTSLQRDVGTIGRSPRSRG